MMKQSEIKALSLTDLQEKLGETREKHSKLKRLHVVTPLENPIQLRAIRRAIARMETELTRRQSS